MTTLQIGSLEITLVSDGMLRMEQSTMFGPDQPAAFKERVHLEDGRVPMSVNCVLVRVGERRILLDTGTGRDEPVLMQRYGGGSGYLTQNLRALGIEPYDVNTVIVSHAHGDHIGGATLPDGDTHVPTFPNARHWFWRSEWDFWTAPDQIAERPFLQRKLPPLHAHGLVELVDAEVEVVPGVRLISAPGHTPGHVCVALTDAREMAIYTGDLLHHTCQLEHPEWSPAFDLLPEMSAPSRRRILAEAWRTRAVLLTAHLPTPGIARPTAAGQYDVVT